MEIRMQRWLRQRWRRCNGEGRWKKGINRGGLHVGRRCSHRKRKMVEEINGNRGGGKQRGMEVEESDG